MNTDILLVEDNPNDVELTLRGFERHHLANRVRVARDGQEALDDLFGPEVGEKAGTPNAPPALVLLDLNLPKVSGLDVLRAIRASRALHAVPVVVLTSSREERDIVESYHLGVNSYLVKPIEFGEFLATAETLGLYWLLLNESPVRSRFEP